MAQAQAVMQKPAWEDVLDLLHTDIQRNFRIDIETNSTIAANSQEDKDNISDAMNSLGQMMSGLMPMVEQGALTMGVVKTLLLAAMRRFDFGRQVEDAINAMPDQLPPPPQPPAPPGPSPEELQAKQAEAQLAMQTAQTNLEALQQKSNIQQAQSQADAAKIQREDQLAEKKFQLEMQKMDKEMEVTQVQAAVKRESASMDVNVKREGVAADRKRMQMELLHKQDAATLDRSLMQQKADQEVGNTQRKAEQEHIMNQKNNELKLSEINATKAPHEPDPRVDQLMKTVEELHTVLKKPKTVKINRDQSGKMASLDIN
ncbi:MAG: hypothetical protein KGI71_05505 [Patescibacteria group bacterium]|nr:hypothetical protein [Patescibacteria group bacterium]